MTTNTNGTSILGSSLFYVDSSTASPNSYISFSVSGGQLNPILYFKYIKSKFTLLQKHFIERRLEELESAFYQATENGQTVLAEKFLAELDINAKETLAIAKGLKYYIVDTDLWKHKQNIRDGHISDTPYENYTRIIPKRIVKEKQKYDGIFDSFVIFHYYNENQKDLKSLSADEKQKMKDPVLFGRIKGSNRLYFIAEWDDEYCDLSFNEIIKVIGKDKRRKLNTKIELGEKHD